MPHRVVAACRALLPWAVLAVALGRFGIATYSGAIFWIDAGSDFEFTLPAGYLETREPGRIPDLGDERWQLPSYPRGPSEYLTILPLALAGSYHQITTILLALYAIVIAGSCYVMWRTLGAACGRRVPWLPIWASTLCFTPLLDAYAQREFEVVILAVLVAAAWAAVANRLGAFGALIAYAGLYKYFLLLALPYVIVRRWWRAVAGFLVASLMLLGLAHALFGLDRFFVNNNLSGMAISRLTGFTSSQAFCDTSVQFLFTMPPSDYDDSVRVDLCRWQAYLPAPAPVMYLVIVAIALGLVAWGTIRLERSRGRHPATTERWRRLLELSLIIVVSTTFLFSHYYYLSLLILPINVMLVRVREHSRSSLAGAAWALAYFLLAMFIVPPFVLDRLWGIQLWEFFQATPARLVGELVVLGLLVHDYVTLPIDDVAQSDRRISDDVAGLSR